MANTPLPQRLLAFLNSDGKTVSLPWFRWFQQFEGGIGTGTPGPEGPAGPQGPQGPAGSDDPVLALLAVAQANAAANAPGQVFMGGVPGPQGDDGDDGAIGPPGAIGASGSTGPTGPTGPTGGGGVGSVGPAGPPGSDGDEGEPGPIGIGVTSVSLSTPLGGGTITTSGTLGTSSYTAHGVLIGEGGSALAVTSAGSTGQVLTSNGASADPTFQAPAGPVKLAAVTTAGNQTTVDFTSISGSYTTIEVIGNVRSQTAVGNDTIFVRFNNDSGANYDQQEGNFTGTTTTGTASGTAQTQIALGWVSGGNTTASYASAFCLRVPDYAGTSFNKSCVAWGAGRTGNATIPFSNVGGGDWANTAAITRLTLILNAAGAFANGLVFTLYGYP